MKGISHGYKEWKRERGSKLGNRWYFGYFHTPGQVKSFIFIRLPFASWFSICIKHSNQRLYRSTLGVDRRSSCRDISSRNPKGYLLLFYARSTLGPDPRKASARACSMCRKKKKKAIAAAVSKPLPAIHYCPLWLWRRGWLARGENREKRGWKGGRAENDDVQKTNRSWRIPDSARFSNAPEKLPVRETFLAAGWHIGTQCPDIVNGLARRRWKRERERETRVLSKLSLIYESSLLFSRDWNDHAPLFAKIEN